MPWKYTDEYYQRYTRETWDGAAGAYGEIMRRFAPIHRELVRRLDPTPGDRIIDLACGPGEPALSLGAVVGPTGRVLGVDLSERMTDLAQRAAAGHPQVEFRTMDCTRLELPEGSFDGATSAFGFQIFTDPEAAAREARRVLRPEGRIAVCVWGTAEKVPFLHDLVGPMLAHAEPDETGYLPTPYETGGPGEMVEFLERSGFRDAAEHRATSTFEFRDPDAYLDLVLRGTPIGHSLGEESPEVQAAVLREARANLERHRSGGVVRLDGEVVYVTARA